MRKLLFILCLFAISKAFSQNETPQEKNREEKKATLATYQTRRNIIKFNPTALIFRSFQFQYERVLTKRISIALSYSFMPEGDVPFKDQIIGDTADDFANDVDPFENAQIKHSNITPEVRFYLGKKGYGKGFYLASFYRSASYDFKNISVSYELDNGTTRVIDFSGDMNSNTFGLLVGAQFNIGNSFVLDWWIAGPHYGTGKGNLVGIASEPLSAQEQESLSEEIDKIDPPFIKLEHEVNSGGASINAKGPWGGVRGGLSIALRF